MRELFPALPRTATQRVYDSCVTRSAYPGGPTTTTACVLERREVGPRATLRSPSLLVTGGLDEFALEGTDIILGLLPGMSAGDAAFGLPFPPTQAVTLPSCVLGRCRGLGALTPTLTPRLPLGDIRLSLLEDADSDRVSSPVPVFVPVPWLAEELTTTDSPAEVPRCRE